MKLKRNDIDGVLLLDKESGVTSHDVVSRLRRVLGMQRVGHAGTLDPDATGLLVVCLGKATKVSSLLTESDKTYRARFLLGRESTTYDSTGQIVAERPVAVEESQLRAALKTFLGTVDQRPPLYSAVKVAGRRLYDYARRGESVEVPTRRVTFYTLTLLSYEAPVGEIDITCSKGTYVRSLIHDLGQHLGAGAITTAIRRTQTGFLKLQDAMSMEKILKDSNPREKVCEHLLSISTALAGLPRLRVADDLLLRVRQGAGLRPQEMADCRWDIPVLGPQDPVLVTEPGGEAVALGVFDGKASLRVRRVL